MNSREYAGEHGYSILRYLADLLTLTRLATAAFILCLALFAGPQALRAAIIAVLVGWLTDTADGPLARASGTPPTWVARMDIPADLSLVFSFFLFLVMTGLYPVLPALGLAVFGGLIVLMKPTWPVIQMVAAPFYALPIVLSYSAGWVVGLVYSVFIAFMIVWRWDRITNDARGARQAAGEVTDTGAG